jgi:hypothetical protein
MLKGWMESKLANQLNLEIVKISTDFFTSLPHANHLANRKSGSIKPDFSSIRKQKSAQSASKKITFLNLQSEHLEQLNH